MRVCVHINLSNYMKNNLGGWRNELLFLHSPFHSVQYLEREKI